MRVAIVLFLGWLIDISISRSTHFVMLIGVRRNGLFSTLVRGPILDRRPLSKDEVASEGMNLLPLSASGPLPEPCNKMPVVVRVVGPITEPPHLVMQRRHLPRT